MQDLSKGGIELIESPPPQVKSRCLLIDTTVSLISTGTERMLIDFGRSGIVAKARAQPEKVAQVIDKAKTEVSSLPWMQCVPKWLNPSL